MEGVSGRLGHDVARGRAIESLLVSTLRKALMALRSVVAAASGVLCGQRISMSRSVETGRGRSVTRIFSNWRAWCANHSR